MSASAGPSGVTASRSTADMLSEISCSTGLRLMRDVTYHSSPPGATFVAALDQVLHEARPHPGGSSLQHGDLVELIGPSGSGKTSLLAFILHTTLLPASMTITLPPPGIHTVQVPLGGKASQATILQPTSHARIVPRIRRAMVSHLEACILDSLSTHLRPRVITPALRDTINQTVRESLNHLRVMYFKPRWKYLYLSLRQVLDPPMLAEGVGAERAREDTEDQSVDVLMIDGLGDPFWPERWAEEEKGVKRGGATVGVSSGNDIGLKEILELTQRIRADLGSVVFLSIQSLWTKASSPFFVPHLPAPYPTPFSVARGEDPDARRQPGICPLSFQLTLLGRVRPLQLPADLTLVEALRDAARANTESNTTQTFEGILRMVGGQGLSGTLAGVRFQWRMDHTGVMAAIE